MYRLFERSEAAPRRRRNVTDPTWHLGRGSTFLAMKVDGGIGTDLAKVGAEAKEQEAAGYDGIWTAETSHDPFFPLLLAAEHTERSSSARRSRSRSPAAR